MTKAVVPTNADDLEATLGDSSKLKEIYNNGGLGEFIKNYANTVRAKDDSIATQIREQTQATLAEMLKENGINNVSRPNLAPNLDGTNVHKSPLYNKKAPGATLDNSYSNTADFLRTISKQAEQLNFEDGVDVNARLANQRKVQNSFGSTVPADGGFLVPETLRAGLLQTSLESSVVRPRATVIPMESLRVPIPTVDSTSNVSSVFGGIVAYWTEEGAALTESQATFGRVVLEAKKLTAYCVVPNELLADASAFGSFIDQKLPQAISFYEDYAFMTGTGVGEPLGFLNCPASVSATAVSGQGANTIVWENLVAMYARMLPSSLGSAVWIASIDTFPQLATMALSVGTGGSAIWLNNGAVGPPMTILGRPVIFTEKTPTLGTTGDISFVDLSYYLIGDRQVMQTAASEHYKFANDQTAFRVVERVDGRPWLQSAITPKNNSSSTLSPFVQLSSTRT